MPGGPRTHPRAPAPRRAGRARLRPQLRRPTAGNLLLPASWAGGRCLDAEIDAAFVSGLGRGRAVDYALHVTSAPCNGSTVAYAGACAVGGPDSRPVMGAINLCPGAFDRLDARRQIEVITHELLHAFVGIVQRFAAPASNAFHVCFGVHLAEYRTWIALVAEHSSS